MTTPAPPRLPGVNPVQNVAVTTWYLQADGTTMAAFKTVSGISLALDVIETVHTTKDGKRQVMKSVAAGGLKPGQITCTRGLILDDSMWEWVKIVVAGDMARARKNLSLVLYDSMGERMKSFDFFNAWPSGWSLGDLDSQGTEALMETLTIEHEGFSLGPRAA